MRCCSRPPSADNMTRPARPTFIRSKGDASEPEGVDTTLIEEHYKDVLRGAWRFVGLPDDAPEGIIIDSLWECPGVGIKHVRGYGRAVLPAVGSVYDVYGTPKTWLPRPLGWSIPDGSEFFAESDEPVLWIKCSLRERIYPWVQLMARAMKSLGTNLFALTHPVMISGVPSDYAGDNVQSLMIRDVLSDGQMTVPAVRPDALGLDVLDLHATDNSQNLISTIQWCDSRILEMLGLSPGVEKSSGITSEETSSGERPMIGLNSWLENAMQQWGAKVGVTISRNEEMENVDDTDDSESVDSEPEGSDSEPDGRDNHD